MNPGTFQRITTLRSCLEGALPQITNLGHRKNNAKKTNLRRIAYAWPQLHTALEASLLFSSLVVAFRLWCCQVSWQTRRRRITHVVWKRRGISSACWKTGRALEQVAEHSQVQASASLPNQVASPSLNTGQSSSYPSRFIYPFYTSGFFPLGDCNIPPLVWELLFVFLNIGCCQKSWLSWKTFQATS